MIEEDCPLPDNIKENLDLFSKFVYDRTLKPEPNLSTFVIKRIRFLERSGMDMEWAWALMPKLLEKYPASHHGLILLFKPCACTKKEDLNEFFMNDECGREELRLDYIKWDILSQVVDENLTSNIINNEQIVSWLLEHKPELLKKTINLLGDNKFSSLFKFFLERDLEEWWQLLMVKNIAPNCEGIRYVYDHQRWEFTDIIQNHPLKMLVIDDIIQKSDEPDEQYIRFILGNKPIQFDFDKSHSNMTLNFFFKNSLLKCSEELNDLLFELSPFNEGNQIISYDLYFNNINPKTVRFLINLIKKGNKLDNLIFILNIGMEHKEDRLVQELLDTIGEYEGVVILKDKEYLPFALIKIGNIKFFNFVYRLRPFPLDSTLMEIAVSNKDQAMVDRLVELGCPQIGWGQKILNFFS